MVHWYRKTDVNYNLYFRIIFQLTHLYLKMSLMLIILFLVLYNLRTWISRNLR